MKIKLVLIVFIAFQVTYSQDFKFGKVSKEEIFEKEHPKDSSADAAVLYREVSTRFEYSTEDGFYVVSDVFERVKIYNKEGFIYATKSVDMYQGSHNVNESMSGLKANTYYLDGANKIVKIKLKKEGIFEEDISAIYKREKFTMPDLREGCVIEYKYSFKSAYVNNINEYRFQELIPVNEVDMTFLAPEYLVYKTHKKGWLDIQIKRDGHERSMDYRYLQSAIVSGSGGADKSIKNTITFIENSYKVTMHNVPAIKEEAYSGNIDNYMSSLKFELEYTKYPNSNIKSYATDWGFVAKSIYETPSFGNELDKNKYFSNDIDALLGGVSNNDEKIMLIFEFVKSKMNWNGHYGVFTNKGVKNAYKDGSGNAAEINLMLTAMFRYAKLNANPILVSTKSNGIPVVPTRNGFDYVIAGVEVNNAVLLFDATNKKSEINILTSKLLNWKGRIIREEGSSNWVPLIPSKSSVRNVMISSTITEDLAVEGDVKMRLTDHFSRETREKYENTAKDNIRKSLEEDKGEIEISNIEFKNLDILHKPIGMSYDFISEDLVEDIDGKLYFSPMLFIGERENPFKLEDRKYPVDFEFPKKNRVIISVNFPEGYTVESMPENASFGLGNGDLVLKYNVSNQGNTIKVMVEYSINKTIITADKYKNLKGYYQLLIEKLNEKVVLIK